MLTTFLLVNKNDVISPILTTTQQYGTWLEETFGEYIAKQELYMKSTKSGGQSVLEWHPGTRIGKWFDDHKGQSQCWYISKDSPIITRLDKYKLVRTKDAVSKVPGTKDLALRLYTVDQIQLYIKSNIDSKFDISKYIEESKQIKVKDTEVFDIITSAVPKKRTLF